MRKPVICSVIALCAACGSSKSGSTPPPADQDAGYTPPPTTTTDNQVRREVFLVDGVAPPANPNGNAQTPAEQNKLRVVRYRVDADPPKPARAVVVMMPGFLAGAGAFDAIARALVRRSADGDAIEAWAIDRRSNLLEDTLGLDVAESQKDASIAPAYYVDGTPVQGKTFAGYTTGTQMPWASEWGIATTLGDLRNVIAKIPEKSRVVLMGHSLGASIVEEYAAWDFAGAPGYKDIAALVLIDGGTQKEGKDPSAVDRNAYENGSQGSFGHQPGVVDVRNGNTLFTLPFLGVKAYVVSEYTAMRARWAPNDVVQDATRDGLLGLMLSETPVPKWTNRAAFGLAFDDASSPFIFVAAHCGAPTGGPIGPYQTVLGDTKQHPTDASQTYAWTDYSAANPRGNTSLDDLARAWYEGPQLNLAEWYFPQRLPLDADAAGTLNVADDDWRATAYGIRAKHGAEIDVPIFAAALELVGKASAYDGLRALVAPIGAGRPNSGKPRTDPAAFDARAMPELAHLDGVLGADDAGSAVRGLYDAIAAFARGATPTGGQAIPVFP